MNLLMLTKFFPYGTGEAFIENEMLILSKYYDKILIIACEAPNNATVRTLPKNVKACSIAQVSKTKKIADAVVGVKYLIGGSEEVKEERMFCKKIKQKEFLGYFESKSQRIYSEIKNRQMLDDISAEPFVVYSYWLFATARVATLIKRDYNAFYMFSRAHRYDLYAEKNKMQYLPYRKLFIDKLNYIFPCSVDGEQYLLHRFPDHKSKVKAALLGTIDHGAGKASDDGIFRIVSCSRIEPVKRVSKIVEALMLLDEENIQLEWTHIGGGVGLEKLKNKAKSLTHIKCIFTDNMPNQEVLEYYREKNLDLFVNVSSSEGLPVSIMEALSFGMPVIATDVGGTGEIVINDITGALLPCDFSTQQLAEMIKSYMNKTEGQRDVIRKNCRVYWEEHFQAMENYKQLFDFIKEDIKNK